jgi:hypothetical protein
VLHRLAI